MYKHVLINMTEEMVNKIAYLYKGALKTLIEHFKQLKEKENDLG